MSDLRDGEAAIQALRIIAERLEAYLDGDELAFETLGECFEEAGCTGEDLQDALMALRSISGEGEIAGMDGVAAPASDSHRVLSSEERASLSPEAWNFLLALRNRGSLDPAQFEQVLDQLHGLGLRPVDLATAREIAVRVALRVDDEGGPSLSFADHDRTH